MNADIEVFKNLVPEINELVKSNHPSSDELWARIARIGEFLKLGHKLFKSPAERDLNVYSPVGLAVRQAKNYLAAFEDRDEIDDSLRNKLKTITEIFEYVSRRRALCRRFEREGNPVSAEDIPAALEASVKLPKESFACLVKRFEEGEGRVPLSNIIESTKDAIDDASEIKKVFDRARKHCLSGAEIPDGLRTAAEMIKETLDLNEASLKVQ